MRVNKPVTNQLRDYSAAQKIVSTTNDRGIIQDVNEHFVDISGFTKEELVGQAHNLVRHPSMPQAAFAELWAHNKKAKPWMGMVKNRCKNGDHYWVDAFVTPMYEQGRLVGYQSVRQKPSDTLIDRAERVYSGGVGVFERLLGLFSSLPLNYKLFVSFSCVALLAAAMLVSGVPIIMVALAGLLGNALVSMVIAKPWIHFSNETKAIFDSSVARHIYTNRHDELGQIQLAMQFIESKQNTILYRTSSVSQKVKASADRVHETSSTTTTEIKTLYGEVEQATKATESMSITVQEVADSAAATSAAADESKHNVSRGQETLQNTKRAIDDLVSAVSASSTTIQSLSHDSSAIDSVVDVISGIAEQTNLLALNAAIEAARAGEQGRGFAVVADEVRSLAAKTQESTGQISEMISNLQNGANSAVDSIAASHEKVSVSVDNINNLEDQFGTILDNVNKISQMCVHIAKATEQQSSVADEINSNINNINEVGQNTLNTTDTAKAYNEKLIDTVGELNDMIKQFNS